MLNPYNVYHKKQWYQLVTSGFVHADFSHLIFNMLSFYFFAFNLEIAAGSGIFLLIYFGSLIISDIPTVVKNRENIKYRSLGASGAVSGIVFSSVLLFPDSKIGILLFPFGIPAPVFGLLYLAYCWYAAKKRYDHINHEAHFWGALTGLVLTIILISGSLRGFFEWISNKV